jgi:WD40 repeat protein
MNTLKNISIPGIAFALVRVPTSNRLLFGSSDFKVYDLDLSASKPEAKALGGHQSYVTGLALAGKAAVSGSYDGKLIWWDIDSRKQIRSVEAHTKWIRKVAVSPDGKTIASVGDDMVCRLWSAPDGKMLHELRGHQIETPNHFPSMLFVCTFSPDGRFVATADKVGHIVVWETDSGKQAKTLEAPGFYTWDPVQRKHSIGGVRSLTFSPDGKSLACGGIGKIGNVDHLDGKARIEIFDWQKGDKTHEYADNKLKGLIEKLQFHPKSDWLLGGGGANDGFFLFFDLKAKKAARQEKAAMHIHDFLLDDKAETIFVAGHGRIQMLAV